MRGVEQPAAQPPALGAAPRAEPTQLTRAWPDMQLGLNKLPWYGADRCSSPSAVGAVASFTTSTPGSRRRSRTSCRRRERRARCAPASRQGNAARASGRTSSAASAPRSALVEFREELKMLERSSTTCRSCCPTSSDVADLLRRIQTLATQSSLVDQRCSSRRPWSASSCTRSGRSTLELDGTYHDLGPFFDHVSKLPRIINVGSIGIKGKATRTPSPTARRSPRSARRPRSCCSTSRTSPAASRARRASWRRRAARTRDRTVRVVMFSWVTSGGFPCSTHCLGPLRCARCDARVDGQPPSSRRRSARSRAPAPRPPRAAPTGRRAAHRQRLHLRRLRPPRSVRGRSRRGVGSAQQPAAS